MRCAGTQFDPFYAKLFTEFIQEKYLSHVPEQAEKYHDHKAVQR
jgi:hypothetical protein